MNEKYKIRSCLCFVFRLKFMSESSNNWIIIFLGMFLTPLCLCMQFVIPEI